MFVSDGPKNDCRDASKRYNCLLATYAIGLSLYIEPRYLFLYYVFWYLLSF